MLNRLAIHIDNIQSAIGCVGKLHGTKPGILGRGKFYLIFTRTTLCLKSDSVASENLSMNKVATRIAHESIVQIVRRKSVAAINRRARRPSEIPSRTAPTFNGTRNKSSHAPFG